MTEALLREIAQALAPLPPGERAALVRERAGRLGVSPAALYRGLRPLGVLPSRKARRDRGRARAVGMAELLAAAAIREEVSRNAAEPYAWECAARDAREEGLLASAASPSTLARHARRLGLDRDRAPLRRFEAARPNQVHQFDVSGADYFYVERAGGECFLVPRRRQEAPYKNRPGGEERERAWFYAVVDDASRCAYGEIHVARGEDAWTSCDFLTRAWGRKDGGDGFSGIPESVYTDNGPFAAGLGAAFCGCLGAGLLAHLPRNPRAKGKVERGFRTLRNRFEARYLRHLGKRIPLEEIRGAFAAWLAEHNARPHPVHRSVSRADFWRRNVDRAALRWAPADALEYAFRRETRRVRRDSTISFEGVPYLVPESGWIGFEVEVFYAVQRGGARAVVVRLGEENRRAEPFEPAAWGNFEAAAHTPDGTRRLRDAMNALPGHSGLPRFGAPAQESATPKVAHLPIRGAEAEPAVPFDLGEAQGFLSPEAALRHLSESLPVPAWRLMPREELLARLAGDLSRGAVDRLRDEMIARIAREGAG